MNLTSACILMILILGLLSFVHAFIYAL